MAGWIELLIDIIIKLVASLGYVGIFLAHFAESAWIPITSELFLLFAGFLVLQGRFEFWGIVFSAAAGFALGSLVPFFLARYGGLPLIYRYGKYFHLERKRIRKVQRWFNRYGEWVVLATRSVPVLRNFITLPAGLSHMNTAKFLFYTLAGFLPWAAVVTFLGMKMGQRWESITPYFENLSQIIVGLLILAGVWVVYRLWFKKSSPEPKVGGER